MNKKNWIRVIGAVFMTMCMMLSLIPVTFLADTNITREIPEDAIYLSTAEDVCKLAEACKVNTWSQDKTIVLNNDIDLSDSEFNGIPTFGGVFIGKGFTIKGLHMEAEGSVVGFFRYLQKSAIVENVNFEGSILPNGTRSIVGGIAGKNAGEIRNCSFKGTVSGNDQIGGLVGVNETTGLVEDCTISGIVFGNHFIGGAVGENHGVVRKVTNYADLNTLSVQNAVSLEDITIDSLMQAESAATTTDIGGIAGTNSGVIRGCTNNGAVGYQHMGYNVGGIAGTQSGYIVDCVNYAQIQGRKEVGGIVGHMEPSMVLDYDTDSLQMLSSQMDALEDTVGRIEREVENGGNSVKSQVDGLEEDVNGVQIALDALSATMNPESGEFDMDRTTAAASDLSNALSNAMDSVYTTSQDIHSSMNNTTSSVTSELKTMVSQFEDVMMTMNNIQSGIGFELIDISSKDTSEDMTGKVADSVNYGKVSGDLHVGGIAGMMAQENDLDEDVEVLGEMSLNASYEIRVVIRNCRNLGLVAAGKQSAGGIVGKMIMGAVFDSINLGNLDALSADYVGGIAGDSNAVIRNCSSKAVLAGDCYVGGIAGTANEVKDCYAFVEIAAATEKMGAVIGEAKKIPNSEADVITGNKFFIAGQAFGGIDGISYTGATDELNLTAFLQLPNLDETFKTVNIIFMEEGQADIVKKIDVGASLPMSEVPVRTVEEGKESDWEYVPAVTSKVLAMGELADTTYISEELLTNVLFDQSYEVFFDNKGSVISSTERTENNLSILLAVGSFAKNTTLEMQDMLGSEAQINGKNAIANYQVGLSDKGIEELHFLLPEGLKESNIKLFVKNNSGNWMEREYIMDGSYLVFDFSTEDVGFALIKDTDAMIGKIAVAAGAVFVIILAISMVAKARKKAKKKV